MLIQKQIIMKVSLTDKSVYIIAAINSLIWIIVFGVKVAIDTPSYVYAWDFSYSHGIIDQFRTPVYPVFLGCLKTVFRDSFYWVSIIIQHLLLLLSAVYFKKMASWMVKSKRVVRWLTLLYTIIPATVSWASCVLTELFALVGIVFLVYQLMLFVRTPSWKSVLWSTVWLSFLILLRPAFLYLLPIVFVVWCLLIPFKGKLSLCGIFSVFLVSLFELCYCNQFEKQYGIFAPSSVSVVNQSYMAFHDGLMFPEYTNNPEFAKYIEEYESDSEDLPSFETFGLSTVSNAVKQSQKTQPMEWIKKAFGRFYKASQMSYLAAYSGLVTLTDMIGINLNGLFLFLIIYTAILVTNMISNRKIYVVQSILWLFVVSNLITVVVGAQSEWGRLMIPSLPLVMLMVGQVFNYIKIQIKDTDEIEKQ